MGRESQCSTQVLAERDLGRRKPWISRWGDAGQPEKPGAETLSGVTINWAKTQVFYFRDLGYQEISRQFLEQTEQA